MQSHFKLAVVVTCVLIGGCGIVTGKKAQSVKPDSAWEKADAIVKSIRVPTFPEKEFNVAEFGAEGDGIKDCHEAFKNAINTCNSQGGGKVIVPAGNYRVNGPIHLKSNVNLVVTKSATIFFGTDPNFYLPMVLTKWEGTECYNYSPLIYAYQATNIAITGEGTLNGSGKSYFIKWHKIQRPDQGKLRRMGRDYTPVNEREFGPGHYLRPHFIQPFGCKNVLIEGVKIVNSPFWTMNLPFCSDVTVRNVTIDSNNFNDDGCDPDAARNVLIEGCNFNTVDDSIAIKAGRDQDAWRIGTPTENVVIRNCNFSSLWGGLAIGSEMSGGVRNVFVEDCNMGKMTRAIHIKSNLDRGGYVKDIYFRNIKVNEAQYCIYLHKDYYSGPAKPTSFPAHYDNINIENVTCHDCNTAITIDGIVQSPISNVTLKNITVDKAIKPAKIQYAPGLKVENVKINGEKFRAKPE